jgi:hypothetical protein
MYQIILTENKEKVKTLHTYSREYDALRRFDRIRKKTVVFPKTVTWKEQVLTPITYEVLLLKQKEEGETHNVDATLNSDEWVIMDKVSFEEEEMFNVTGSNRKLSAKEILEHVILPRLSDDNPKQLIILNNKLVIEGLALNVVTCKDVSQTIRLYNFYREMFLESGNLNIMFSGIVEDKSMKKEWYKKIHERTGMSMNRLYRKSSR